MPRCAAFTLAASIAQVVITFEFSESLGALMAFGFAISTFFLGCTCIAVGENSFFGGFIVTATASTSYKTRPKINSTTHYFEPDYSAPQMISNAHSGFAAMSVGSWDFAWFGSIGFEV